MQETRDRCDVSIDPEDDSYCLEYDDINWTRDGERVWRCPHPALPGTETTCCFHTPPSNRPPDSAVAEEIYAVVKGERKMPDSSASRPPQFIDAKSLDIEGLWDPSITDHEGKIDLRHAEIVSPWCPDVVDGNLDLKGATFHDTVDCSNCLFTGWVGFAEATFTEEAKFINTTFLESSNFRETTFEEKAKFTDATFRARVWFTGADFEERATFKKTSYNSRTIVSRATFNAEALFNNAVFEGETRFKDAEFEDEANFCSATFLGHASFDYECSDSDPEHGAFRGDAIFRDITARSGMDIRTMDEGTVVAEPVKTVAGDAQFDEAEIVDGDFSGLTAGGTITFDDGTVRNARFKSADLCGARFANADLSDAVFRDADCRGADFEEAMLSRTILYGSDFRDAYLASVLLGNAHVDDDTRFVDRGFWSPRLGVGNHTVRYDPRTDPQWDRDGDSPSRDDWSRESSDDSEDTTETGARSKVQRAASVYARIEILAKENARSSLASTCFRWRKDMERRRYRERAKRKWPLSYTAHLVTRYGDSPWRVVVWIGLIMVTFAGAYPLTPEGVTDGNTDLSPTALGWVYYSVMTFTTLGAGQFDPQGSVGRTLAMGESLLGAAMLALLVAVLVRRAAR